MVGSLVSRSIYLHPSLSLLLSLCVNAETVPLAPTALSEKAGPIKKVHARGDGVKLFARRHLAEGVKLGRKCCVPNGRSESWFLPDLPFLSARLLHLYVRGRKHIKLYTFHNSVTYGWEAGYYTSYESYVCALSSDVW